MWDQLVVGAAPGDAITQSALLLREWLLRLGPSELYAQHVEPGLEDVARALDDLPSRPNRHRPLVFHASMGSWPVHRAIMENESRLVLVYHNFSPPEPFVNFAPEVASDLIRGRWELEVVRDRVEIAIADSDFNAAELIDLGYPGVQVIPPTPDVDRLSRLRPDPEMARKIRQWGSGPLVLCVAQQLPHKRIERVMAAVAVLQQEYQPRARLAFVGVDRFPTYTRSLHVLADAVGLGLPQMFGRVSNGELAALYSAADVFLTLSDHEGFCIPAVEAMAVGIPVVASNRAAIPSTVGDAGILIDKTDDPTLVAGVLDEVLTNPELRTKMIGRGIRRAHELSAAVSLPQLFRAVTGLDPIIAEPSVGIS